MRTDVLRSTSLLGAYGHADRVLLGELCLRGKFHEVPEPLFLRRLEEGESPSLYAHQTRIELARLYGRRRSGLAYPRARRMAGYVRAIAQAELSVSERARCFGVLAAHRGAWRAVAGELRDNALAVARRRTGDAPGVEAQHPGPPQQQRAPRSVRRRS